MNNQEFKTKIKNLLDNAQAIGDDKIILDWTGIEWKFNTDAAIDENYIKNMKKSDYNRRQKLLQQASELTIEAIKNGYEDIIEEV